MNLRSHKSFLRRFVLATFTVLAIPWSLAQDIADFATPVRAVDFLHMDLRLSMTADDIKARRMHGVVTYKIRVKEAAGTTTVLLDVLPLEAVGLDIASVELAGGAKARDAAFAATTFVATGKRLMIDVKPHGVLVLEATRTLVVDEETTVLVLSGMCETRNVTREGVVQSNQLANLMLSIQHEGPVHDAGSKGWLTRAVEAIFPF